MKNCHILLPRGAHTRLHNPCYILLQKMDKFSGQLVQNDRLAFDYVFCPPETKQFKFKLLQVYILPTRSYNDFEFI